MFELIYTSYHKGLQVGSSGFTSVAYTEGMPKSYIQLCESLSGYLFIYPLSHPLYKQNPEVYSHYIFKIKRENQNQVYEELSILSRVAAVGMDYTGRENKIAHHIVLSGSDRLNFIEGPAYLMAHSDLFVKEWNQEPCFLKPKKIENSLLEPSILNKNRDELLSKHWQRVFGDAKPAFMLAKSAENSDLKTPSFILFDVSEIREIKDDPSNRGGGNYHKKMCLNLALEALNLIAPEKRWSITFNTYFSSKPIDSDCLWRFCPIESKIYNQNSLESEVSTSLRYSDKIAQKYPNSLIIDLKAKRVQGNIPTINELDESCAKSTQATPFLDSNLKDLNSAKLDQLDSKLYDAGSLSNNLEQNSSKKLSAKMGLFWLFLSIIFASGVGVFFIFAQNSPYYFKADKTKMEHQLGVDSGAIIKKGLDSNLSTNHNELKIEQNQPQKSQEAANLNQTDASKNNTIFNKKMVLRFYDNAKDRISQIITNRSDLKKVNALLIRGDGIEIHTDIESPILNDTPNWDIVPKGGVEPVGQISINSISLYDRSLYAAIFLDLPSRLDCDLIWAGTIKITPEMVKKALEPDTLEIIFKPEISKVLYQFFLLLSSDGLTGEIVVEKQEELLRFRPICSIKKGELKAPFIELKFTKNEFESITKDIKENEKEPEEHDFLKSVKFKEIRVDYTDKDTNRTYPILCLNCK
ncbi:MAG: hypothetical protein HQK71_03805 [Desulfamplus sp.]|nr:hypothetical protein [Desulfamplus sp.]